MHPSNHPSIIHLSTHSFIHPSTPFHPLVQ
jgi:hypothetical protein